MLLEDERGSVRVAELHRVYDYRRSDRDASPCKESRGVLPEYGAHMIAFAEVNTFTDHVPMVVECDVWVLDLNAPWLIGLQHAG